MGNTRIQEVLAQILRIANSTAEPSLRITKIAMATESALDELRQEQRNKEDNALLRSQVEQPRRESDGDALYA